MMKTSKSSTPTPRRGWSAPTTMSAQAKFALVTVKKRRMASPRPSRHRWATITICRNAPICTQIFRTRKPSARPTTSASACTTTSDAGNGRPQRAPSQRRKTKRHGQPCRFFHANKEQCQLCPVRSALSVRIKRSSFFLLTPTMTATLDSSTVAQYLSEHPDFFAEHTSLLGEVKLSSPLTGRTISLQERQMEVMRDKYKALELRMSELMRLAAENESIANKFHRWTQTLLQAGNDAALPSAVADGLKTSFDVPQVTLRLWNTAPDYADAWFARDVS